MVRDIQELFFDSIGNPEALRHGMHGLRGLVGSEAAQFLEFSIDKEPRSLFVGEFDENSLRYESEYWQINPRAAAIPGMRVGKVIRDDDIICAEAISKNAAYQELLIPGGFGNFGGTLCQKDKDQFIAFAIFNGTKRGRIDDQQVKVFARLSNSLIPVFKAQEILELQTAKRVFSLATFGMPAVLLDCDQKVKEWNVPFSKLLESREFSINKAGFIQHSSSDILQWRNMLPQTVDEFQCQKLVIRDTDSRVQYILEFLTLPTISWLGQTDHRFSMIIFRPYMPPALDELMATKAYGLTVAEADVLRLLTIGHSTREIAEKRSTSVHTVQTQVKRILEKAQVRSQVELVGLVSHYLSS